MKNIQQTIAFFLLILTIASCKKNDGEEGGINPMPLTGTVTITLAGKVLSGTDPVQGAIVKVNGFTATTDIYGIFLIKNVNTPAKRCILNISKNGFFDQCYAFHPTKTGRTHFIEVQMIYNGSNHIIPPTGGTVTLSNGASINFPANAFVIESTGAAIATAAFVKVVYLNNAEALFGKKIPGRDLRAVNKNGEDRVLESFGMINVEIRTNAGEKLQLAPGKTASIIFPVAASQLLQAGATIPLWYFNDSTALWNEEGSATLTGNNYVGSVSHFTWWNCDYPYPIATTSGTVMSCNNTPQPGADILVYNTWLAATTDNMGEYTCDAPAQYPAPFDMKAVFASTASQLEVVPVLSVGQQYILPDFILGSMANLISTTGSVTDCSGNPTSAFITVSDNTGSIIDYTFTTTGNFTVITTAGAVNTITASGNSNYGSVVVSSPLQSGCTTSNAGTISLCNASQAGNTNFSFTVIDSISGSQTFNFHAQNCSVGIDTVPFNHYTITFSCFDSVHNVPATVIFGLDTYTTGTHAWQQSGFTELSITTYIAGNQVNLFFVEPGSTIITTAPSVGSNIVGTFNGYVEWNNDFVITNGFFDVPRIN